MDNETFRRCRHYGMVFKAMGEAQAVLAVELLLEHGEIAFADLSDALSSTHAINEQSVRKCLLNLVRVGVVLASPNHELAMAKCSFKMSTSCNGKMVARAIVPPGGPEQYGAVCTLE